jgi:serine/threonine protein kinase
MAGVEQLGSTGKTSCIKCGTPVSGRAPLGLCRQCLRTSAGLTTTAIQPDSPEFRPHKELADLSANQSLDSGRFTLVEALGAGGMGVVWLALDERLSRESELVFVALKFLVAEIRENPQALDFLKREVLQSRRLNHPNILRIYDWHQHPGEPVFFSMEFLPGVTLRQQLERRAGRPMTWTDLSPLINQLCEALDYAHRLQKIVHRDLKPANVMVTPEAVLKLADFGLARPAAHDSQLDPRTTHARGTPHYMSPQQMRGQPPRPADDIYSFGATLYELLTGVTPFEEELDIFAAIETIRPKPISARLAEQGLPDNVPARVRNTVAACLEKDMAMRPQTIREVSNLLGLGTGAFSPPLRAELPKAEKRPYVVPPQSAAYEPPPRRSGFRLFLLLLLFLVAAVVGASWYFSGARSLAQYQNWVTKMVNPSAIIPDADRNPVNPIPPPSGSPGADAQAGNSVSSSPSDLAAPPAPIHGALLQMRVRNTYRQDLHYVVADAAGRPVASGDFDALDANVTLSNLQPNLRYTVQAGHGNKMIGSSWVNYETKLTNGALTSLDLDFEPGDILLLTPHNENVVIERRDLWNNLTRFDLEFRMYRDGIGYYGQENLSEHTNLAGRLRYTAYIPNSYYQPQPFERVALPGVTNVILLGEFTNSPAPLPHKPWTNSLDMRLIWIERGGFWSSRTETTVAQYASLIKPASRPGEGTILAVTRDGFKNIPGGWWDPGFNQKQSPDCPVVGVSWDDAANFCEILTTRERSTGRLGPHQRYSLPTDDQWTQLASGLVTTSLYPWGDNFQDYAGNYATTATAQENWPPFWGYQKIPGRPSRTSPVGLFPPNINGLSDVGRQRRRMVLGFLPQRP